MAGLRVLLWKELLDLLRDRRTLATTVLLPLISLPSIGLAVLLMSAGQTVNACVIDMDRGTSTLPDGATVSSSWLAGNITEALKSSGVNVVACSNAAEALGEGGVDVLVVIPSGFSANVTSFDRQAHIEIYRRVNVGPAINAEGVVRGVVAWFSGIVARMKVAALAESAGLSKYDPEAVLDPVSAGTTILVAPGGGVASPTEQYKVLTAKILVLGIMFVVTPASMYVIDGIVGERERRTFEMLLTTPASLGDIVTSKLLVASMLGLLASAADVAGLIGYLAILAISVGAGVEGALDPALLALHAASSFFTTLVCVGMALPFVSRARGLRSASNVSSIVTSVASASFFTGFFVDYPKLESSVLLPLYASPFTHSIMAIQCYIYGSIPDALAHLAILVALSGALLFVSSRTINVEKLIAVSP
ncbi:MAG: ABC transporter permease subunit [Desulfurococcaceae archaeon]